MDGKQPGRTPPLQLVEVLFKKARQKSPGLFYCQLEWCVLFVPDQFIGGIDVGKFVFVIERHFNILQRGLPFTDPATTPIKKISQAWQKVAPAQANRTVSPAIANRDGKVCTAFFECDSQSLSQIVRQERSVAWHA